MEMNDDFLRKSDKIDLIVDCTNKIKKLYTWADDNLFQILVLDFYKKVVASINQEQYLKEIDEIDIFKLTEPKQKKLAGYLPEEPEKIVSI